MKLKPSFHSEMPFSCELFQQPGQAFDDAHPIRLRDGDFSAYAGPEPDHFPEEASCALQEHEMTFAEAQIIPLPAQSQIAPERHRWVLIADDDSLVRGSLAAVLESEGYFVDEASDGHEAVRRAIMHPPDLVLLDLNMPGWDGWTAFSQLDRVTPLVPVIVITARPNQYSKAVQLGVDAFMEKPLNIPILMRAIKHLTSEDAGRHLRRITDRDFVTKLLGGMDS